MKRIGLAAIVCALSAVTSTAFAGGLEYNGPGARAMGRGGAFAARADDPMALQYNQSRMVDLEGTQLMLSINAGLYNMCFQRDGRYIENTVDGPSRFGTSTSQWAAQNYHEVCNDNLFQPGASLILTHRFNEQWAIGAGLLTPTAAGGLTFGANDGTIRGGSLPNPARYTLVAQHHLLFFPTVAVAYKPVRWFRAGVGFQWGIGRIDNLNYVAQLPGQNPENDIRAHFVGTDWFVPGVLASVDFEPMDGLNFMLGFHWTDAIHAQGSLDTRAGDFGADQNMCTNDPNNPDKCNTHISGVKLDVPRPLSLTFGARYAMLRPSVQAEQTADGATTEARPRNPMHDEIFDVELDAVWERNSMVTQFDLQLPMGTMINAPPFGAVPVGTLLNHLPHQWKDQVTLKVGGDWNAIQDLLAVRLGFHWESSGIDNRYAQLDFFPSQRFGAHVGATVRLLERLDLSLAYAHVFQTSVTTSKTDADYHQITAAGPGIAVNAGTYRSSLDVISFQASYRF